MSSAVSTPPIWLDAADMAHDLRAGRGPFARRDCALERLGAVFGDDILGHANFGANHDIRVLADRSGARVHLRKIDIVKLGNRKRCESDIGNMYKCVESRATLRHDVAAEGRKIIGASITRRNAGGGALVGHKLIGGNADGRTVWIDVAVKVH
jgi:hypothetical protein